MRGSTIPTGGFPGYRRDPQAVCTPSSGGARRWGRHRRDLALLSVGMLGAVALVAGPAGAGETDGRARVACNGQASSEAAAVALAVRCARRVEVGPTLNEYSSVYAEPDGRLVFESAVEPQRARRADGSWAGVDLNLHRGADGLWRPVVSVADVRFSGGGRGPAVTLVRDGKTFTLSWLETLPAPSVSAEAATYADVLPDVDLVLRATATGFTHIMVVKSAQAAANPAVLRMRFKAGGDAAVVGLPDGSLRAQVGGQVLASAEPAVMWDSSESSAPHPQSRSDAAGPGDAARRAKVPVEITSGGELTLTPDAGMLSPAGSRFPVFVDPAWSVTRSKWAYATNNGSTNEYTVARVGRSPDNGVLYRSFFEFPTTANGITLKGKHIESAYVQMKLDHSWSCGDTWTYMYATPLINSTPKATWSKMGLGARLSAAASHANEAGGCGVIYPDMIVNFTGADVTSRVQTAANGNWSTIAVGFCACYDANGSGESTQDKWKKFFPSNAKLIVDYDSKPGTPTGLQVAGLTCVASGTVTIGTLTPTLSAVYPDGDASQTLTGSYEWVEVPPGGVGAISPSTPRKTPPPNAPAAANTRATTAPLSGVVKDKTYAYRVRTTDPAPYSITSPWSGWCAFRVDTSVPPVTVTILAPPAGPGTPVTFRIESTATDVTKFRYGWTAPTTEILPQTTNPKSAQVTLTVPKYGLNILYVSAVDATLNEGYGSTEFTVARPSPAVAKWGLETYPGVDQAAALADQAPALAGDTPLTPGDLTWTSNVRLIGGRTATLAGTSSSQLSTSGPVLNTTRSFGVAAWVRLNDSANWGTIVSQDGTNVANFQLQLRNDDRTGDGVPDPSWCFTMRESDTANIGFRTACAVNAAAAQRWTHVAGAYDATAGKLRVYVDGILRAEAAAPPAWAATGPLRIGSRKTTPTSWVDRLPGSVADVQVFDRVLVDHDFTGQLASDPSSGGVDEPGIVAPVLVGDWNFEAAVPCYAPSTAPGLCEAPEFGPFGRRLGLTQGSDVGPGNRDNGLLLDGTHWTEDPSDPYYQLSTQEHGWSQQNLGDTTNPIWQDTPVLRTDQSFTVSAWVRLDSTVGRHTVVSQDNLSGYSGFDLFYRDSNGGQWVFAVRAGRSTVDTTAVSTASAVAGTPTDSWHHLVGVLDTGRRQVRLYVDGDLVATSSMDPAWQPWNADGPLVVGRSDRSIGFTDWLHGRVDDLLVYQGALTDAQVWTLHDGQSGTQS